MEAALPNATLGIRWWPRLSRAVGDLQPNLQPGLQPGRAGKSCTSCGRSAKRPWHIPPAGWRDVLIRTWGEIESDNVIVIAGGVAFFALFGAVPALTVLVSLYGLLSSPDEVAHQVARATPMLPPQVRQLIRSALQEVVSQSRGTLGAGAAIGLAISAWTASRGTRAMLRAINIAYDQEEARRGVLRENALAFAFTIGGAVAAVIVFGLVLLLPFAFVALGWTDTPAKVAVYVRWPLLFLFVSSCLATLYRHGAIRRPPKWPWVIVGALAATVCWLLSSMALSAYVRSMGRLHEAYGSLAAVVILLAWLYISALVIVLGAELNAELEHQTEEDTTVGPDRPLGERGAYVADHVGPCRPWPRPLRRTLDWIRERRR